jgi:drug/metabolite transporter (DMT)-like permease
MSLVCAIWGGAFVAIKIGLFDMPPLGSAALRFFLMTVILFAWARVQRVSLLYRWTEIRILAVLAFLFFYFNLMIYVGTAHTTSGRATVFFYTQPIFLALLAHYFLPGDRLTTRKTCGLVCALCGLATLFLTKLSMGQSSTLIGDILVLSGALATAIQNLIIKRAAGKVHPVAIVLWSSLVTSLLLGMCSWRFEQHASFIFSTRALVSLLYLSFISGAFGFVAFAWLLQHNPVSHLTALVFLAPVFGVLFGWLLLGETLTGVQLLGVAAVCFGVYVVTNGTLSQVRVSLPREAPARA